MSFLTRFFQDKPPALGRVFRVKITRSTMALKHGASAACDVEAGEVIEVGERDASALVDAGCGKLLGRVDASTHEAPPPKPRDLPKVKSSPDPVPADYSSLPKDFSEAWKLVAARDALVRDLDAVWREAMPKGFDHAGFLMGESRGTGPEDSQDLAKKNSAISDAREALRNWDTCHGAKMAEFLFKAGNHVLERIGAANTSSSELAETGFRIFRARIASLELSDMKARQLFEGSGVALRYASFPPIGCKGATFMGPGHGDTLDEPIPALAHQYRRADARCAQVAALLPQAKAELEAAELPSAPAKRRAA